MKKEWYAAKELVEFEGLPSSTQGIHDMARRQSWVKRRRWGVQGRAVEYHIDALPIKPMNNLEMKEPSADYVYTKYQDPLAIWLESYKQLDDDERDAIIKFIVREGMSEVLARLSQNPAG